MTRIVAHSDWTYTRLWWRTLPARTTSTVELAIAALLQCRTVGDLWAYLTAQGQETFSIVEAINHYLKRIVVKKVRLADFKPPTTTIEKEQIVDVAIAFQAFLEEQLQSIAAGESSDALPMLQVE